MLLLLLYPDKTLSIISALSCSNGERNIKYFEMNYASHAFLADVRVLRIC